MKKKKVSIKKYPYSIDVRVNEQQRQFLERTRADKKRSGAEVVREALDRYIEILGIGTPEGRPRSTKARR